MIGRLLSRWFGSGSGPQTPTAPAADAAPPPGAAPAPARVEAASAPPPSAARAEAVLTEPRLASAPGVDAAANAFKALLLRELLGEAGLLQELTAGCRPAGAAVRPAVRALAVRWGADPEQAELLLRQTVPGLAALRSAAHDYPTRCRAALCLALLGRREDARALLRDAAAVDDSWARHHHLAGLLCGLDGDSVRALAELRRAREAEPFDEARRRIGEALDLVNGLQWRGDRQAELPGTAAAALPEDVRQLAALLGER